MTTILRATMAGCLVFALAACSSDGPPAPAETPHRGTVPASSTGTVPALATTVRPLAGTGAAPFDETRRLQAPPGWPVTVWARMHGVRLLAWTPDGRLLVSRPKSGDVVELALAQGDATPTQRILVSGLNQPHGLAFTGDTLYLAESDQVDRFTYRAGTLSGKRVVVDGLPDAKSPELQAPTRTS